MKAVNPFRPFGSLGTGQQLPVGTHRVPVDGIVFIALVVLLIVVLPVWPYSRRWGYYPVAVVGLLLILLLALVMFAHF